MEAKKNQRTKTRKKISQEKLATKRKDGPKNT
jgi:hypothetical protein